MSDVIETAVAALKDKMSGESFAGTAKFVIEGEGSVIVDGSDVRAGDDDADVTLTADADTFQSMMDGDTNPTAAYMSGKLSIDGDMGKAMQLASALA
ncbi:SCP2 sterol-binding domain-containing protein [Rhodalgimonas zhirmunskyi]|uniref:SCP2 sterol-binding domain-containing protein n=1 Tax=Rhodalgimonas zhirmunskyi TaxID=2964767 RepID=A0AAJ1U7B2_9RHOB|nr:SCP2 sterol-binding domain-containing protein [Rhodoalgimonas zhirmunskyi]MDQ2094816.1 SCP2 sterol-binding domain-containing protein [Rhodoalgimonas zhirmunskyi]